VARRLSRNGVPVYALGTGGDDPVRYSRHRRAYVRFEAGAQIQRHWLAWLEREAEALRGAVLLPCNDEGLELIAKARERLHGLGYRPFKADDDVLMAMLDKRRTYAIAREIGVPTPRTLTLSDCSSLEDAAGLGFPVALKPAHSHLLSRRPGWGKVVVVDDRAHLQEAVAQVKELDVEFLLTEIIPGGDDEFVSYYSYIDDRGEPLFHFTKRKLRQNPPSFGLITYQVTEWHPEVAALGLRFFQGAGVRGLANVEFKRDRRDGRYKLIECNHRFTAANEVVEIAGLALALLTYERALGRPGPVMNDFREGIWMWSPVDDVRALRTLRQRGELSGAAWLRTLGHRQRMPVFSWSDVGPTLVNGVRAARWARRRFRPQ
jgi:D-aspartate ligase